MKNLSFKFYQLLKKYLKDMLQLMVKLPNYQAMIKMLVWLERF